MKNKNFFQRMAQLIAIFGLSLLIGNISAFIAMNMLSIPKDTLFFLWQRQFIDAMVQLGMIKGMWLLFIDNIVIYLYQKNRKNLLLLILSIIVFVLGEFFIVPLSYETSRIAFQQYEMNQVTSDFLIIKHKEDVLGGFNLFILLIYLIINIFYKQEENKVKN
ncbi:hypothetical protein CGC50_03875 [Capnocytophaga gingivalis]|jgi:hypothetical protein|uniref:DUF4149 domain-containing protein n=1 Tax=Capnocytophaga gingivalis TaxID=1017 RepID=A0A250FQS7_9FLAO|nr:hypothetical protein [Capnocytophaga gingivalis]ATA86376.1 hypothetical protein CGC50_03875 [Capnocytophaga gingivalis]